jgi:hypothetical protein
MSADKKGSRWRGSPRPNRSASDSASSAAPVVIRREVIGGRECELLSHTPPARVKPGRTVLPRPEKPQQLELPLELGDG